MLKKFYGFYAADPNDAAATTKWGFFQKGTLSKNYFNGRTIIGSDNTGKGIGAAEINGKLVVSTIDSSAAPANMLWQDPVTGEIKKAAPGTGGATDNIYTADGALTSQRYLDINGQGLFFEDIGADASSFDVFIRGGGGGTYSNSSQLYLDSAYSEMRSGLGATESGVIFQPNAGQIYSGDLLTVEAKRTRFKNFGTDSARLQVALLERGPADFILYYDPISERITASEAFAGGGNFYIENGPYTVNELDTLATLPNDSTARIKSIGVIAGQYMTRIREVGADSIKYTMGVQDAGAAQGGAVSTGAQTFAGNKTFSGNVVASTFATTNNRAQLNQSGASSGGALVLTDAAAATTLEADGGDGKFIMSERPAISGNPAAGFGWLYARASDSKLVYEDDAGTIYDLTDNGGGGLTINNNADNRLLTANGGTTSIDGESALTWDATALSVGTTAAAGKVTVNDGGTVPIELKRNTGSGYGTLHWPSNNTYITLTSGGGIAFYRSNTFMSAFSSSSNFLLGTGTDVTSAKLLVATTTQGAIPAPKMTSAQRNAIASPTEGLQVFNTTDHAPSIYDGTTWQNLATVASGTFANRPSAPLVGQKYYQTDLLSGTYTWNGAKWVLEIDNSMLAYSNMLGALAPFASNTSGTGAAAYQNSERLSSYRVDAGTTTTGNARLHVSASFATIASQLPTSGELVLFYDNVYTNALSDGTNTYIIRVGRGATGDDSGIFFKYTDGVNSGQWQCITHDGTTATTTNTSVALVANTDQDFLIVYDFDGTDEVRFYIDGTLVATHTTNLPTTFESSAYPFGIGIEKTAGTTNRMFSIDNIYIKQTGN